MKKQLQQLRQFGGYIADWGSLFHEQVKSSELGEDEWLRKTFQLCQEHFYHGRDFTNINLFAVLELPPSARKEEIEKAYRLKAKDTHPDRQAHIKGGDKGARFLQIQSAKDTLSAIVSDSKPESQPFDIFIRDIHTEMRHKVKQFLSEQNYSKVESVLFHMGELHVLDDLVSPPLESAQTSSDIMKIVRGEVESVKKAIDSNWAERKYQSLNSNISDLKSMADKFKGYPKVFSESWNSGIIKMIEQEIVSLRQMAQSHISDQATAKTNKQDFRRCFIEMGKVLVELAPFKEFTKARMNEVLESCLGHDWGYSYLFEFGLGLQRSNDSTSEEENLVAQMILTEFCHFKEVLTMVWNEETTQKPVEETVKQINGVHRWKGSEAEVQVDTSLLLKSFWDFEAEYESLLGDYLHPDADISALVNKIIAVADSIKPCSCVHNWTGATKEKIPRLLSGIFAVFTILKSGESYNRVESSGNQTGVGDKILMKPHNIQVLTLLCMFGCGSLKTDSLESQLMQIRTGEGKSIILGAAAVLLGLLDFRVRCVCYSDYLSTRDYNLFRPVFEAFHLTQLVKYSKITTLSEDTTAAKGNIRLLSENLLRGEPRKLTTVSSNIKTHDGGRERREIKTIESTSITGRQLNQELAVTSAANDQKI